MHVVETVNEGLKRGFKVTIPAAELASRVDAELAKYGAKVRLPGFRPGKVPMAILRQRFRTEVMGEVVQTSVRDSSDAVLKEHALTPASEPKLEVTRFDEGGDLEYALELEILPEVPAIDFSGISLERPKVEIEDQKIDEQLARIAEANAGHTPVTEDRPLATGDIARITFHGRLDGQLREDMHAHDHNLKIGSGSFIPGFEEHLIGMGRGETRTFTVHFPEDYHARDLAGKEAEFSVDLQDILNEAPVTIDDQLAERLGFDSLLELRDLVRSNVEGSVKSVARSVLKRRLLDQLHARIEMPLPQSMVETEFESIWRGVQQAREQGQEDEDDRGKDEETLRRDYREIAERRVKLGLVLAHLGRKHEITVSEDELRREVMKEARRHPGHEQEVLKFFSSTPQALNRLHAPLFEEKVVDFILELVTVQDRVVTQEELEQLARQA